MNKTVMDHITNRDKRMIELDGLKSFKDSKLKFPTTMMKKRVKLVKRRFTSKYRTSAGASEDV